MARRFLAAVVVVIGFIAAPAGSLEIKATANGINLGSRELTGTAARVKAGSLQIEATATGVKVRVGEFTGTAARVKYDEARQVLILSGSAAQPAEVVRRRARQDVIRGITVRHDLNTGEFVVEGSATK